MTAKLAGHVTHYSDGTWSARGAGWSVIGNGSRDDLRGQLGRHGYMVEGWKSVSGVCYDAPDGTPIYSDIARVHDRRVCGECGQARVSHARDVRAVSGVW